MIVGPTEEKAWYWRLFVILANGLRDHGEDVYGQPKAQPLKGCTRWTLSHVIGRTVSIKLFRDCKGLLPADNEVRWIIYDGMLMHSVEKYL